MDLSCNEPMPADVELNPTRRVQRGTVPNQPLQIPLNLNSFTVPQTFNNLNQSPANNLSQNSSNSLASNVQAIQLANQLYPGISNNLQIVEQQLKILQSLNNVQVPQPPFIQTPQPVFPQNLQSSFSQNLINGFQPNFLQQISPHLPPPPPPPPTNTTANLLSQLSPEMLSCLAIYYANQMNAPQISQTPATSFSYAPASQPNINNLEHANLSQILPHVSAATHLNFSQPSTSQMNFPQTNNSFNIPQTNLSQLNFSQPSTSQMDILQTSCYNAPQASSYSTSLPQMRMPEHNSYQFSNIPQINNIPQSNAFSNCVPQTNLYNNIAAHLNQRQISQQQQHQEHHISSASKSIVPSSSVAVPPHVPQEIRHPPSLVTPQPVIIPKPQVIRQSPAIRMPALVATPSPIISRPVSVTPSRPLPPVTPAPLHFGSPPLKNRGRKPKQIKHLPPSVVHPQMMQSFPTTSFHQPISISQPSPIIQSATVIQTTIAATENEILNKNLSPPLQLKEMPDLPTALKPKATPKQKSDHEKIAISKASSSKISQDLFYRVPGVPYINDKNRSSKEKSSYATTEFDNNKDIFFESEEKFLRACMFPGSVIDFIRKGYKLRYKLGTIVQAVKVVEPIVTMYPECSWRIATENGFEYFELLLLKTKEAEQKKLSKSKKLKDAANDRIEKEGGVLNKTNIQETSDSQALADVFDDANVSSAKNQQNKSSVASEMVSPSTSFDAMLAEDEAETFVAENFDAFVTNASGTSDEIVSPTNTVNASIVTNMDAAASMQEEDEEQPNKKRQRTQQFDYNSSPEKANVLHTVAIDGNFGIERLTPSTPDASYHMLPEDSFAPTTSVSDSPSKETPQTFLAKSNTKNDDAALLLHFSDSDLDGRASFSAILGGAKAFHDLIEIRRATTSELNSVKKISFLPEAIAMSRLHDDQREGMVLSLPKFFNPESILWKFGPDERSIGVVPSKNITNIESIPLPFKADPRILSSLDKFIQYADKHSFALTFEQFINQNEYRRLAKSLNKLNFSQFQMSSDDMVIAPDFLSSLYEIVQKQNWSNCDPLKFIRNHLPGTQLELIKYSIQKVEEAVNIQTYSCLMNMREAFPSLFDFLTPVLVKYRDCKHDSSFKFSMKKVLFFKEKLFQLASRYDSLTKGKKSAEECLAKAMTQISVMLSTKDFVNPQRQKKSHQSITQENMQEMSEINSTLFNPYTLFPLEDGGASTREKALFEYDSFVNVKQPPYYSPEYFLGKGRRKKHLDPQIIWHIDRKETIIACESQGTIYQLVKQRKYFDKVSGEYICPPITKVIGSYDPFFKKRNGLRSIKLTSKTKKQSKLMERFENFCYDQFEKAAEMANEIHECALQNTKTFFGEIYQALQETFNAKITGEDLRKRRFFEMFFYLRGTEWARKVIEDIDDGPAEGMFPILGNNGKVVALFLKFEEWLDVLLNGTQKEKSKLFPEMEQLLYWRDHYHYPGMRDSMRMDPDGVFHFPEYFHSNYKHQIKDEVIRLYNKEYQIDSKDFLQMMFKLRLAAKTSYQRDIKNRIKSQDQAAKLLNDAEEYAERRNRASTILHSFAEATFNFKEALPECIESAFKNPRNMLVQEAIHINRGHVPPRFQTKQINLKNNKSSNSSNLLEKSIQIRKLFDLASEKQNSYEDFTDDELMNALNCEKTTESWNDIALNNADLNERLYTHALYEQYIEANRGQQVVNRMKEANHRFICHFRREEFQKEIHHLIALKNKVSPFKIPAVEKPLMQETLEENLAANQTFNKISKNQRRIRKKIAKHQKQTQSKMTDLEDPAFRSKTWLARAKSFHDKISRKRMSNAKKIFDEAKNEALKRADNCATKIVDVVAQILPKPIPSQSKKQAIKISKSASHPFVTTPFKKINSSKARFKPLTLNSVSAVELGSKKVGKTRSKTISIHSNPKPETSKSVLGDKKNFPKLLDKATRIFEHLIDVKKTFEEIESENPSVIKNIQEAKNQGQSKKKPKNTSKPADKKLKKDERKKKSKNLRRSREILKNEMLELVDEINSKASESITQPKVTKLTVSSKENDTTFCALIKTEAHTGMAVQTEESYLQEKNKRRTLVKVIKVLKKETIKCQKQKERKARELRNRFRREAKERKRIRIAKIREEKAKKLAIKAEKRAKKAEKAENIRQKVLKVQEAKKKKEAEIEVVRKTVTTRRRRSSISSIKSLSKNSNKKTAEHRAQSVTPAIQKENLLETTTAKNAENEISLPKEDAKKNKCAKSENNTKIADAVNAPAKQKISKELVSSSNSVPGHVKEAGTNVIVNQSSAYDRNRTRAGRKRKNVEEKNATNLRLIAGKESKKLKDASNHVKTSKPAIPEALKFPAEVAATTSAESGSSNSPELGNDFGLFLAHTQRRSNETIKKADQILFYEQEMPEIPLIVDREAPADMKDIAAPPYPIMEVESQFTQADLPLEPIDAENDNDDEEGDGEEDEEEEEEGDVSKDATTIISTTSSKGTNNKKKLQKNRYDKKVKWSRKKNLTSKSQQDDETTNHTPTPTPPQPTKQRKPRIRHKWRQTPSRTPSPPPPSPPLPKTRQRIQPVRFQINYDSPRKRKLAENNPDLSNSSSAETQLSMSNLQRNEKSISEQPIEKSRKPVADTPVKDDTKETKKTAAQKSALPTKAATATKKQSTKHAPSPPPEIAAPRRVGRPKKNVESSTEVETAASSSKSLGKRTVKKRVSLSPEPIPVKRKNPKR